MSKTDGMKYAGHLNYKIGRNPDGPGWLALYKCPAAGCGVDAFAASATELGPYNGSCSRGHEIHVPSVVKTSPN